MGENGEDWVTTDSVAWAVWHLAQGEAFSTRLAAESTGLSREGAYKMLCRVSLRVPIVQYEGKWMASEVACFLSSIE